MTKALELIGQRFGRLIVKERAKNILLLIQHKWVVEIGNPEWSMLTR